MIWFSLYLLQTLVGAVFWKRYRLTKNEDDTFGCLVLSAIVLPNIVIILVVLVSLMLSFIAFLASLFSTEKEEHEVKCTGNNGNGCYLDSCGHDCGCEGISGKNNKNENIHPNR